MDQGDLGNNPNASASIPLKRKRGRPRKYPKLKFEEGVHIPRNQNLYRGESSTVPPPPGFEGINGNQPRQAAPSNDVPDVMVGKAVSGVIEAVFDAGYLLKVRVDNSDATLRGVVFKSGRCIPVSEANDIAPDIQMIRRHEIPFPAGNYTQFHGHNPRSKERNEQQLNSQRDRTHTTKEAQMSDPVPRAAPHYTNHVGSKSKQVHSTAAQTASPAIPRGSVVPVLLQPANLSNGLSLAGEPTPLPRGNVAAVKGKQIQVASHPSNGSVSTSQLTTDGMQASQPQTNHQPIYEGLQFENGRYAQPPIEMLGDTEARSMKLPGMPFEKLVTEVIKRIQVPPEPADTQTDRKSAVKMPVNDSDRSMDVQDNNVDQPLAIEPLQSVEPGVHNQPEPASKPVENDRTSKMSELLQVLQDTVTENQAPEDGESASASGLKSDDILSPETANKEKGTDDSKTCP
ncbi:hypothetical protein FEM48_Zijuj01G0230000 [Ziziphus jujuba var. spinosa]|uniref:Uncharacterized protein n=1 Tax=Ziziphus jujuba var. spinosa TaxID=714518 RepID=A0A978W422_ZIZJJ|nr:hypothetical protein FEM48_Zijuj01G0230000 [Ziziphus jujuba var. spinosa]